MTSILTPRRLRTLLVHSRRWQRRLIFIAGGLLVGLIAVGLAIASDSAQLAFHKIIERWPWSPLALTPLGFRTCGLFDDPVLSQRSGVGHSPNYCCACAQGNGRSRASGWFSCRPRQSDSDIAWSSRRCFDRTRGANRTGRRVRHVSHRPSYAAPTAWSHFGRRGGWGRCSVQYAPGRHCVRHRGDESKL